MKFPKYLFLAVVLAVASGFPSAISVLQDHHACGENHCYGKDTVPIEVVLSAPFTEITPGATVNVRAIVTAQADFNNVNLQIDGEGITLLATAEQFIGSLSQGEKFEVDIPVLYDMGGRSAVLVTATGEHWKTGEMMSRREGVYTVVRNGRPYSGLNGFVALDHSSVRDEFNLGFITEEEFEAQIKEAMAPDGQFDQTPRGVDVQRVAGFDLPALEPVFDEGVSPLQLAPVSPTGTITVQGAVLYTDENGATHPAYGIQVEVWDEDTLFDEFVTAGVTGTDGLYSFVVDNDDGILQNGRDVYVKFVTKNEAIQIQDGSVYENQSGVHDELSDGATVTENFTYGQNGDGPAGCVCVGASYIAAYVKFNLNGGVVLPFIPVNWPAGGAFYDGSSVNVRAGDRWDWDVLHHEYGHYVMDEFNFEDNPGGSHSSASCAANVRSTKSEGLKLAWGESWPTYFGLSAQAELGLAALGMPRVGDSNYQDFEDGSLAYSLENNPEPLGGDDNERSLMRIFWDLYDNVVDGNDNVAYGDKALFDLWDAAGSETFTQGWAAFRASGLVPDNQTDLAAGAMISDYGIGPIPVSPAAGAVVSPSNADFSWTGAVGCGTVAAGDEWDLVFYHPTTYAKILTIPGLNTTTTSLSQAQLTSIMAGAGGHDALWAVEGKSTASPATGPYLGANFPVTINQPPIADAGDDVTAECESSTGTQVALNGTGSSDPDGDALTYSWEPAELFDDPSSATPTGTFELGTVEVTLTVNDGLESDSDIVKVTIEDTTAPSMTCPGDITVECSAFCGTPADDTQLVDFFDGFEATDICSDTLMTSLDNPDCFTLGMTTVRFTAEDCSGNTAVCSVTVNVVDTSPPEISVELNRDVLWPPNHKMADISAVVEVSDICCETPTFVLATIISNEPDNHRGDGNTSGDVQAASFGTDDVAFQLRSERKGDGDGRIYTIVYTAEDCSGNTADDTVRVRVPHDQSGLAFASTGFNAEGLGFDPALDEFVLIVPSTDARYELDMDGNEVLVEDAFDASAIDASSAYVGNLKGVIRPYKTLTIDNDGDGLKDIALYYSAQAVNSILSASSKTPEEDGIKLDASYGAMGLHYVSPSGVDCLVPDIFALGEPVALVPTVTIGRVGDTGGDEPEVQEKETIPNATELLAMYPNPFNPTTTIPFNLSSPERVSLRIYDAQGKLVRTLADESMPAGIQRIVWDGRDNSGNHAATGVYFVRLLAGNYEMTKKVVMIK